MIDEEVRAAHVSTQPVYPLARNCSYATTSCKHIGKRSGKCVLAFAFAEPATGGIDGPKYQQAGDADRCHRPGYDSAIARVKPRAEYPVRYGGEDRDREYHRQGPHSPSFHGGGPAGEDAFVFQGRRASKSWSVLA